MRVTVPFHFAPFQLDHRIKDGLNRKSVCTDTLADAGHTQNNEKSIPNYSASIYHYFSEQLNPTQRGEQFESAVERRTEGAI
jgi:hypothetical protein